MSRYLNHLSTSVLPDAQQKYLVNECLNLGKYAACSLNIIVNVQK